MAAMQARAQQDSRLGRLGETARRAYVEFLHLPILIIAGFLLLAAGTSVLDFAAIGWLETARAAMREHMFRDSQATSNLLATIAGGIITVTSITFSLLLLAVQQAASALTHQVYDQFMRRRVNQVYFGFFVGLAVYTLVVLGTVNAPYNPVFGATAALLLTIAALVLMILLLYTTLNQMRPVVVIETIHDHVLAAWDCHRDLVHRTRREAQGGAGTVTAVRADAHGYVVRVDLDVLAKAAGAARGEIEVLRVDAAADHGERDALLLADVRATARGAAGPCRRPDPPQPVCPGRTRVDGRARGGAVRTGPCARRGGTAGSGQGGPRRARRARRVHRQARFACEPHARRPGLSMRMPMRMRKETCGDLSFDRRRVPPVGRPQAARHGAAA